MVSGSDIRSIFDVDRPIPLAFF